MYTAVMATGTDEPFIDAALASIRSQELPPERTIVVVNGPLMEVRTMAATLRSRHPWIEVVESAVPSIANALFLALQMVESAHVAFLDADDEWLPDKQTRQIRRLRDASEVHVTIGCTVNFRGRSDGTQVEEDPKWGRVFGAATFRMDCFREFGWPDPTADHFTWLYRWWTNADRGGVRTDRDEHVVLMRRVHESNLWRTDRDRGSQQLLRELRRIQMENRKR